MDTVKYGGGFDAVVLDIKMPGIDGVASARRDQEVGSGHGGDHAHRPRLPVIRGPGDSQGRLRLPDEAVRY